MVESNRQLSVPVRTGAFSYSNPIAQKLNFIFQDQFSYGLCEQRDILPTVSQFVWVCVVNHTKAAMMVDMTIFLILI